mgnify:FL=1
MSLEIYNKVRSVPEEAQTKITGGRLIGFTDVNPMWRIKMLTELFGACGIGWYAEIIDKRIEVGVDTKAAFVDVALYIRERNVDDSGRVLSDGWSKPIVGTGGSEFVAKEKNGLRMSDEAFKMAYTDALSVCCKMLGFAADIYFEKDRTKYDAPPKEEKSSQNSELIKSIAAIVEKHPEFLPIVDLAKEDKHVKSIKELGEPELIALHDVLAEAIRAT